MRFRLVYRGPLSGAKKNRVAEKQKLREYFHPQLKKLWTLPRMKGQQIRLHPGNPSTVVETVGGHQFVPLITNKMALLARLEVLFMRPGPPGNIYASGGDVDNRLKTLLDGLRMPVGKRELPTEWQPAEDQAPLYCLLQDDSLVTGVSIDSDHWLEAGTEAEVLVVVTVHVEASDVGMANLDLLG